ncbi:pannexin-1a [Triplophysa rosa]|uniref:Pannexin-1 n=1 Tax=Triplophysa rosa TaxID=992332 RepID=A0A9W7TS68_TRIRA|nr:pannexin-1a [Triplophysa rosa]KAI7800964.1 pannexin-1 [Triplophysa rosa]
MAIAHAATEYVFSDFVLKEPATDNRYKGIRLDLAMDKMVTCIAVGLPLLLISLAFAQEVSVGTQISCFSPTKFSWRQAAYVDSYCWAAVQTQDTGGLPLWLHKFFPYILLLVAVSVYMPALFWRFTGAPVLSSDLTFIMEELDSSYNRAIKLAKSLHTSGVLDSESARVDSQSSVLDLTESCFKYPLVEQYLKTKRYSIGLLVRYIICRAVTFLALLLACIYLCYYIRLSVTDEFQCNIRSGVMVNDSSVPPLMQCKLIAVGIFQLLSYINLCMYLLLLPLCLYAVMVPFRMTTGFLKPFEMLPTIGVMHFERMAWDDLALYLLFLEENLSELKSYKCLKVIELLKETGDESIDTMLLLRNLAQVKTDAVDGRSPKDLKNSNSAGTEMKEVSPLLQDDRFKKCEDDKVVHKRTV